MYRVKKNVKCIIAILIVLFIVIVFCIINELSRRGRNDMKMVQVGGLMATWEYIEREIDLEYFYQLDNTTTYEQIEEEIGKPNGYRGSGLVLPYYQINKNSFVVLTFSLDEYGKYDKVGTIYVCNKNEMLEKIYPQ